MSQITTWPMAPQLNEMMDRTPDYMRPNDVPIAVLVEGILTIEECNAILKRGHDFSSYKHDDCGALTRELGDDEVLDPLADVAAWVNKMYFNFDLDNKPYSWMQMYEPGDDYQLHMDQAPGQMRKMTAVLGLTSTKTYIGGHLVLHYHPQSHTLKLNRGDVVIFPGWLLHEVTPLQSGMRATINMGFYGPNWR